MFVIIQMKEEKVITVADYTVHVKWIPESIRPHNDTDIARVKETFEAFGPVAEVVPISNMAQVYAIHKENYDQQHKLRKLRAIAAKRRRKSSGFYDAVRFLRLLHLY